MKDIVEVKFANVGRKKQHKVTLFKMLELPFEIDQSDSRLPFSESRINHYYTHSIEYLKARNIHDIDGYFCVVDGEVKKCDQDQRHPLPAMPLWAAIEERDKSRKGQTGDYLAALIIHKCKLLENVLYEIAMQNRHKELAGVVLDTSMEVQELFFRLYLLENVHSQYSAGESRTVEANRQHALKDKFENEAEDLFREYRRNHTKESSYEKVANRLKKLHQGIKTPSKATIKTWFKSRIDLP